MGAGYKNRCSGQGLKACIFCDIYCLLLIGEKMNRYCVIYCPATATIAD